MPNIKPDKPAPLTHSSKSEETVATEDGVTENIEKINQDDNCEFRKIPRSFSEDKAKLETVQLKQYQNDKDIHAISFSIKNKIENSNEKLKYLLKNLSENAFTLKKEGQSLSLYLTDDNTPLIKNLDFNDTVIFLSDINNRIHLLNINYDNDEIKQALSERLYIKKADFLRAYNSFNKIMGSNEKYRYAKKGMCYGIASIVPNFFLKNSPDVITAFTEYLACREDLINQADDVIKKYSNNKKNPKCSVEVKQNYLTLKAVLDNVFFLQGGIIFDNDSLLQKHFPNQDNLKALNVLHATAENFKPFQCVKKAIIVRNKLDLTDTFNKIKQLNSPIAIMIHGPKHTISIAYHPQLGFYGTNHDRLTYLYQPERLSAFINHSFPEVWGSKSAVFLLDFIIRKDDSDNFTGEFFKVDMHEQFENNTSLEQKKMYLYTALNEGQIDAVNTVINSLSNGVISQEDFFDLLLAENDEGHPGLYVALENGHHETVKAFIDGVGDLVTNERITSDQAVSLLIAENDEGHPGLYVALKNGHHETVKVYINSIGDLVADKRITSKWAVSILKAKNEELIRGLYVALENGHHETVKAFIDGVGDLVTNERITSQQAVLLLNVQSANHFMGVDIARKNGHTVTVQVFNDGIRGLVKAKVLSDKQGKSILKPSFFYKGRRRILLGF